MHMHSEMMSGMSVHHNTSIADIVAGLFEFPARLAAEILVILTSGPILHFLAALVLLLTVAVLLRILLTSRVARP
jgi:hypothetical protein